MTKLLYLVRHGETLFNNQKRIQGWCDSPLTEIGIKQAKNIGNYFRKNKINIDYACCSTSERAVDTLKNITNQPFDCFKEIKEMNYGKLEGHPEYLAENDPKKCETYYLQFDGESSLDVRTRMKNKLTEIMECEGNNTVLAISHGGAIFNFLKVINADLSYLNDGSTNGAIFILNYENKKFSLKEIIRNSI